MHELLKPKTVLLFVLLCNSLLIHAQQLLIAVQQHADSVVIYTINEGKQLAALPTGAMPHEITFDPQSGHCFITNFGVEDYDTRIGTPGRSITVLNPYKNEVLTTIQTGFGAVGNMPHGIKVRPGKRRELFVNIERPDSMLIYDLETYQEKRRFVLPPGTHNFIFSEDGKRLWLMAGVNGVYEIDPQNGKIKAHKVFQTPIRGLAFLNHGLLASGNNELHLLEKKNLDVLKEYKHLGVGQILYSAVTHDQKYILCPAPYDSAVVVVDAHNGAIVKRISTAKTPINIQVTETSAFVSHAAGQHITQIDLTTFNVIKQIAIRGTNGLLIIPASRTSITTNKKEHGLDR